MLDNAMFELYKAYWNIKLQLMKMEQEEDGMEIIQVIILIAIGLILAVALINFLGKDESSGFIGDVFGKIKEKFEEIFS